MICSATVQDQTYHIEVGEQNPQRKVQINTTDYTIDWRFIAPLADKATGQRHTGGRYSLLIGGQSYEVFARCITGPDETGSQTYEITLAGQRFEVQVEDEREKALTGSVKSAHDASEARVRAPMPGLVAGIPVERGESVTRGQAVVILEAMKMENDLSSPIAGIVKEIRISTGQTVNQGDILVVISGEEAE